MTTPRSTAYETVLTFARAIVGAGPEQVDPDTVLDAQADLVMHACVRGYEDEYDPELDFAASDEQREEAAELAQRLDQMHSVLWNRIHSSSYDDVEGEVRRRR